MEFWKIKLKKKWNFGKLEFREWNLGKLNLKNGILENYF